MAGCCLLVAAGGRLGAVHSWSFVASWGFHNGRRILLAPLTICLRDNPPPSLPPPLPSFSVFSTSVQVFLLISNQCFVKGLQSLLYL